MSSGDGQGSGIERDGLARMAFETAKTMLADADTSEKRAAAIRSALRQGMSLSDIEAYLDVLDLVRAQDEADRRKADGWDQPATER